MPKRDCVGIMIKIELPIQNLNSKQVNCTKEPPPPPHHHQKNKKQKTHLDATKGN